MELLQLEELRKVEREEKAMMASSDDAKLVLRIGSEGAELQAEYRSLMDHGAIKPLSEEEFT